MQEEEIYLSLMLEAFSFKVPRSLIFHIEKKIQCSHTRWPYSEKTNVKYSLLVLEFYNILQDQDG